MNNRFKFRLYDKKIKEMIYADNKTQNNINLINYLIYCNNAFIDWDIENYVLMQCTGLKDKNGKLIYEGDIINVKIDGLKTSFIPMVVVWDRKEWQLKQYNKNFKQNCSACEVKTKQKCQYCSQYFSTSGHTNFKEFYNNEVIGNIYENEDLLKCENQ